MEQAAGRKEDPEPRKLATSKQLARSIIFWLTLVALLGVTATTLREVTPQIRPFHNVLYAVGAVCLGILIHRAFAHAGCRRRSRYLAWMGTVMLAGSPVLDLVSHIPGLQVQLRQGTMDVIVSALGQGLYMAGLGILFVACFVVLFELLEMHQRYAQQNEALRKASLERLNAEVSLRATEQKMRLIFDHARDGIVFLRPDLRVDLVNGTMASMLGYSPEEMKGKHGTDFVPPDDGKGLAAAAERRMAGHGEPRVREFRMIHRDGSMVPVESNFALLYRDEEPIGIMGVIRDITSRKRAEQRRRELEERLQRAQRLESLGVLAGGIAHRFNNLLQTIQGNTELLLDGGFRSAEEDRCHLLAIDEATQRAAVLSGQMLAYSGKGHFVMEYLDMGQLCEELSPLLQAALPEHVRLDLTHDASAPLVRADRGQMRQMLVNLVTNAGEAIHEEDGTLRIVIESRDITSPEIETMHKEGFVEGELRDGHYVALQVRDNGCGIDAETLPRIIEPFYTTRFPGRGLGLAATIGIIRGHEGALCVTSEPDEGSCFTVYLPAAPPSASAGET